jgi:uncharacterized protein YukE
MSGYLNVDVEDLHRHALHVDAIGQRMSAPIQAGQDVTPGGWSFAFGVTCQFFAVMLHGVGDAANDANARIQQSLMSTGDKLHISAGEYGSGEQARKWRMESISNEMGAFDAAKAHVKVLLDKSATFDPGVYGTDGKELGRGDYSSLNPFTPGPGHSWVAGSGFLDDGSELKKAMRRGADHSNAVAGVMAATLTLDGFGLLDDPIGTLGSWLGGWVLEHVKPIRLMLDGLAGNPDMVQGVAQTWTNISRDLKQLGVELMKHVDEDTAHWAGEAGDAYREKSAGHQVDALAGMSELASGIGILVDAAGKIVDTARGVLRDILAMAIGEAVRAGLKELGISMPTEVLGQIAREIKLASETVKAVIGVLEEMGPLFGECLSLYQGIAKILPHGD